MTLEGLNNTTVANAGAGLVATSTGIMGGVIVSLSNGTPVHLWGVVAAFAGILVGATLAYCGRPATIPPARPPTP